MADAHRLIRGFVEAYDVQTHTADVRPAGHPTALLAGVPVALHVAPQDLVPGMRVVVLLFGDVGGVVLAAYESA